MLIECAINVPPGYKPIKFGLPKAGDLYLVDSVVSTSLHDFKNNPQLIIEKELTLGDLSIGEEFTFPHHDPRKIVCKKVRAYWRDAFIQYLIDNEVFCTFGNTPVERVTHTTGH